MSADKSAARKLKRRIERQQVKAMAKRQLPPPNAPRFTRDELPPNQRELFDIFENFQAWLDKQTVSPQNGARVLQAFEQFARTCDNVFAPSEKKPAKSKPELVQ